MGIIGVVLLCIIIAVALVLSVWILWANKKSKINRSFFAIAVCILLWNVFAYLGYRSVLETEASLFFKLNFATVSLYFIAFYYFTNYFPSESEKRNLFLDKLIVFISLFFVIVSLFSDLVIKFVEIPTPGQLRLGLGIFGNLFYLYTFLLTIYIIYTLIKKYRLSSKEDKSKAKYFLVGTLLYAFLNIIFSILVSFIYPNNYNYTQLGDFSAIFFLGFTAYAIMKHQLFNIKVIATETIVIMLSLALLIEVFLSKNISEGIIKAVIWLLATYGGYQLIKSVKIEIKQKEDLKVLSDQLQDSNKKLEEANEELKKLDKTKDEFISVASHELNTPLAAIEGYLSMILDENMAKIDDKAREFLRRAYQSSKRLAALITDLLNVSRIEQGRIHLQYAEADIYDLIEESVNELQIKADQKKIKLGIVKSKEKLPKTWCDTTRIHEVIVNFTGNAIKFTDKGGVTVGAEKKGDSLQVFVKDSGVGIAKEDLEALFHKFSQLHREKMERQGTGLGLYISRSYIELHGGKVWAESEGMGKGTTFYFTLPILKKKPFDPHEGEGSVIKSQASEEVLNQVMQISKEHAIKE